MEAEGEVEQVAWQIVENAERTLTRLEKAEDRILPAPEFEPGTAGLSARQKAEIVKEHGQAALMDLHMNRKTMDDFAQA